MCMFFRRPWSLSNFKPGRCVARFLATQRSAGTISTTLSKIPIPPLPDGARRFDTFSEARLGNPGSLDKHDLSAVRGEDALSYLALQLEAGTLRTERFPSRISTQRRGCAKRERSRRVAYTYVRLFGSVLLVYICLEVGKVERFE